MKDQNKHEQSLDPENWDEFQDLAHKVVDDLVDYLKTVGDRPVWTALPDESKSCLKKCCH